MAWIGEQAMKDLVFTVGQVVVATGRLDGYQNHLTAGKEYTVTKYEPKVPDANASFTWPAYVTVIGDLGEPITSHTYRFRPKD